MPPIDMTVINTPKPMLLIPTSSIPKREENGTKKDIESPNMKLVINRIGKDGIPHTYRSRPLTAVNALPIFSTSYLVDSLINMQKKRGSAIFLTRSSYAT